VAFVKTAILHSGEGGDNGVLTLGMNEPDHDTLQGHPGLRPGRAHRED
jgi:hypothetical protein